MDAKKVARILELLDMHYPDDKCFLYYETDYQLLFATILSAQCTDARVNMVTKDLFAKYKTLEDFASAELSQMEQDIKTVGFYHVKAKNLILTARALLENHDSTVPSDMEKLTALPGVGRKTANLIRSQFYNIPSIVVDTHVQRVSRMLGLTGQTDPHRVEIDLTKILPEDHWTRYNTQVISFGREICRARGPKCELCFLKEECETYNP